MENHVFVNMLLCSSHSTELHWCIAQNFYLDTYLDAYLGQPCLADSLRWL